MGSKCSQPTNQFRLLLSRSDYLSYFLLKKKNTLYLFHTLFALFSHLNFSREWTRVEGGFSCDLHWGTAFKFPCCGLEAFFGE